METIEQVLDNPAVHQLPIRLSHRYDSKAYRAMKRCADIAGALFGLVILSPILLATSLAILLTEGRPLFFWHKRIGQSGRSFRMMKFRTMRRDAEAYLKAHPELMAQFQENYKLEDDPRVTKVGKFLRSTSIDEMPQLYNVLVGEMSLVGPRPVVLDELARFGDLKEAFLSARPGVAGLWQCSGRSSISYEERVALEVQYLETASMRTDISILFKTVASVLKRDGAH